MPTNLTEEAKVLLTSLTEDFERLKQQKSRPAAGVEGTILLNLAFVHDEQYVDYADNTLKYEARSANQSRFQFNLISPRLDKLLGRISSVAPTYRAQPTKKDPAAEDKSKVVDQLIRALDAALDQTSTTWQLLWWMAVGGTAFEYVPWVPNATIEPTPKLSETGEGLFKTPHLPGQEIPESAIEALVIEGGIPQESFEVVEEAKLIGQVGSEVLNPLNVFIDQSVESIRDLAPDQRVYIARIRTVGWVKENFNVDVKGQKDFRIVSTKFDLGNGGVGSTYLKDLIPTVQGSVGEKDPEMVMVVESFLPASLANPRGRYTVFIPSEDILHDDENPYEEIPLVDFHWAAVTTNFWTRNYVTPLIAPQRFINRRFCQLAEQANATLYSQLLLGPGLSPNDVAADQPAPIVNGLTEEGVPRVGRTPPPEFPSWFMASLQETMKVFNDIAGGPDLFQDSKFPGQLRGPQAVPMLQEILDTQWGPLYQHIGERMARVKQMRLNRVKKFYPPVRTLHYTSKDQKNEVLEFHTDEILRAGTDYDITIERGSLLPELRALREARITERLSGPLAILYMDGRTGKIDKTKVAADLGFGDLGREDREAKYRTLGAKAVEKLRAGLPIPPVMPFYDHAVMLDELEAWMATEEYWEASPQVQAAFTQRYEEHRAFLVQEAQAQAQMMQGQMIQGAVAQATQQAAATAAAKTVESSMDQMEEQRRINTDELVRSAAMREGEQLLQPPSEKRPANEAPGRRPAPSDGKPPKKTQEVILRKREG